MRLLLIACLWLISSNCLGQFALFENLDLENGDYSIIFQIVSSKRSYLQTELGNFVVDDIEVLRQIKKEFIIESVDKTKLGGPYLVLNEYQMIIYHKDSLIQDFGINLETHKVLKIEQSAFLFDPEVLLKHKDSFKKIRIRQDQMKSRYHGFEMIERISNDTNLIAYYNSDWIEFQGEFRFNYPCKIEDDESCFWNAEKYIPHLESELDHLYPDRDYELELIGGNGTHLFMTIRCNDSLYQDFKVYPIRGKSWTEYEVILTSYWKD